MIPKILHIVWIGDESARPDSCIDTWRELNPDFDLRVWGNQDLASGQWTNREHMKALLPVDLDGVMNLMRYEILQREGGVSPYALSLAHRPLPDWLLEAPAFACWTNELDELGILSDTFLGAAAGSEFYQQVVDDIHALPDVREWPARQSVGPVRLTRTWRATRFPLSIHPSHYFAATYGDICSYTSTGTMFAEYVAQPSGTEQEMAEAVQRQGESTPELAKAVLNTHPGSVAAPPAPASTQEFTMLTPFPPVGGAQLDSPGTNPVGGSLQNLARHVAPQALGGDINVTPAGPAAMNGSLQRLRVVVATDWQSATVPLAAMRAFAAIVPSGAPIDLVLSVPHEPGENDRECVGVLVEAVEPAGALGGLSVESFAETAGQPCFAALIPNGDADQVITEVASFVVTLHRLAEMVELPNWREMLPAPTTGHNAGLARRLSGFTSDVS